MKTLAEIVVGAAVFFELSPDDTVDPDDAVRQLEDIAYYLQRASDEEKQAVLAVCRARLDAMDAHADAKVREFYQNFGDSFGFAPHDESA